MGDRTWVEITTFPENKERVEDIMEYPPDDGWDENNWAEGWNQQLVRGLWSEINCGVNSGLTKEFVESRMSLLAGAGGYPGAYSAHVVAFHDGVAIEVDSNEDGIPVVEVHDGQVSEAALEEVRKFEALLLAAGIKVINEV
jgi:hypothetical protein